MLWVQHSLLHEPMPWAFLEKFFSDEKGIEILYPLYANKHKGRRVNRFKVAHQ
jgi:hypothetical protein